MEDCREERKMCPACKLPFSNREELSSWFDWVEQQTDEIKECSRKMARTHGWDMVVTFLTGMVTGVCILLLISKILAGGAE